MENGTKQSFSHKYTQCYNLEEKTRLYWSQQNQHLHRRYYDFTALAQGPQCFSVGITLNLRRFWLFFLPFSTRGCSPIENAEAPVEQLHFNHTTNRIFLNYYFIFFFFIIWESFGEVNITNAVQRGARWLPWHTWGSNHPGDRETCHHQNHYMNRIQRLSSPQVLLSRIPSLTW